MQFLVPILAVLAVANAQLFGGLNPLNAASKAANAAKNTLTSGLSQNDYLAQLNDFGSDAAGAVGLDKNWDLFKGVLGKTYSSPEEEKKRKGIFIDNINIVKDLTGKLPFGQKLNDFADLVYDEFQKGFNGFGNVRTGADVLPVEPAKEFKKDDAKKIPDSIDWRQKGAVTPVKFQNNCAGCYAFAAAGALEGQYFLKTGQLKNISVQNLLDCSQKFGNNGCLGGLMNPAYQYIKDNSGVNQDEKYPFESKEGKCRYDSGGVLTKNTGFVKIKSGDENALKEAVATVGPVSAAMDASPKSFQFYGDGIYNDPACQNAISKMNHAVLVVGYGEENGKKYWLVKNSYGTKWGMDGYFKLARDENNHCGIATWASYPTLE